MKNYCSFKSGCRASFLLCCKVRCSLTVSVLTSPGLRGVPKRQAVSSAIYVLEEEPQEKDHGENTLVFSSSRGMIEQTW